MKLVFSQCEIYKGFKLPPITNVATLYSTKHSRQLNLSITISDYVLLLARFFWFLGKKLNTSIY